MRKVRPLPAAALAAFAIAAIGSPPAGDPQISLAQERNRRSEASAAEGKYEESRKAALEAAALYAKSGDRKGEASALNNAGVARLRLGDYDAALADFERSAELCAKAGDTECEILRRNNAGAVHYYQGRYSEAARQYRTAAAGLEGKAAEPWYARAEQVTQANLAALQWRLGHYQEALAIYRASAGEHQLALNPRERARLQGNLGALYRRLGDPVHALRLYREAAALLERDPNAEHLIGVLRNTGIVQGQDLHEWRDAEATFRRALALAENSRNWRMIAQCHLYLGEILRATGREAEGADRVRRALTLSAARGLDEERWKALHALGRDEESVSIIEGLRVGIGDAATRQDFLADKRAPYDDWIAKLLEDKATPNRMFAAIERLHGRTLRDRLRERGQEAKPLDLQQAQQSIPAATVLAAMWRHGSQDRRAVVWSTRSAQGIAAGLTDIPVLRDAGIRHLIVIPDGEFQAETEPWNGGRLIQRFTVTYLPTASLMAGASSSRAGWLWPWQMAFAGYGDPVGGGVERLAASGGEVEAIAKMIGGRHSIFLREANRKERFVNTEAALIHLGTHAAADVEHPEASRVIFSSGDVLYLREVYGLQLHNTGLITLAACETERGTNAAGEGVRGFSQAFLAAGAGSVVTSLRRVEDRATAALMKHFYYHLALGESKAEALRQAKLRMLRSNSEWAKPEYWSAFVLLGDGAGRLPRAVSWFALAGTLGTVLFGSAAWLYRRR